MHNLKYILLLTGLVLFGFGCSKESSSDDMVVDGELPQESADRKSISEGHFEVVFASDTKAAVTGPDARIQDVKYLLFKSTGEFVKERRIVAPANGVQTWPLLTVRDTLPKGAYQAVFVGNAEKTLFPYATSLAPVNYNDVLTGYQNGYSLGRIVLPPAEFASNTEYYMANVTFSNASPNPTILLQRIISQLKLHRNFVDAQTALNKLVNNIVTQVGYRNLIRAQVSNILPGLIFDELDLGSELLNDLTYGLLGGLDAVVNALVAALIEPVTEALYQQLLQQLTNQIGIALTGNADQSGLLAFLGVLLNPWATSQADAAIVTINDFPKSVDFNLQVQERFTGLHKFKFKFTGTTVYNEKDIPVKGFSGLYDVRKINVVKQGILAGVVIDNLVDGPWLLNGTFIDVNDPITHTLQTNYRYKSDYSLLDIGLKSYTTQTDGPHSLTLTVLLSTVPNLDGIIKGLPIFGPILNTTINTLIIQPLGTIIVSVPVNIPLLGIDNLTISGGWSLPPQQF